MYDITFIDPPQDDDLAIPITDQSDPASPAFDPEAIAEEDFTPRPLMCMYWPGL